MGYGGLGYLDLHDFGYSVAGDVLAQMTRIGTDMVFVVQGNTVTFSNSDLDNVVDDMIL